ncbi:hypothetical protein H5410_047863 [Solanum commersonii]|uniref:Uncharacterized protein n=1 Tax=Solanum commersonii TaxID=4109 RepID=A0A9J5XI69_SOLCO|nr:hypothetical protein H5410_047863 [Solanum commersonii]
MFMHGITLFNKDVHAWNNSFQLNQRPRVSFMNNTEFLGEKSQSRLSNFRIDLILSMKLKRSLIGSLFCKFQ